MGRTRGERAQGSSKNYEKKALCTVLLRGCLHGQRRILALGRSEKAKKLFVCFTCRNFGRSGYQVEKEKKNNCRP